MKLDRLSLACLASAIAFSSALAGELAPPKPSKTQAHAAKPAQAKSATRAADQAGGLRGVKFSDPNGPPVGASPASNSSFAPATNGAPKEPASGVSLGVKWRATNEPIDPYDAIRHTSGPDGPGDTFEGGIKLGF